MKGPCPKLSAEENLENHGISYPESRCLRYSLPDSNMYSINLMWTPSYVQASGDVGDLTFCHHAAFRTFDGAMSWLAGNSTDYQLSKTTAKKEPSLEKTIEYIEHQIVYAKDELEEHVDPSTQEGIDSMMTIIEELRWKENPDLIPDIIFSSGLFDDYYGSYEYRWRDVFVLECVRLAARQYLWEEENAKLSEKCL